MLRPLHILAACLLLCSQPAAAQRQPLKGMVWTVPSSDAQAARDLEAMEEVGVEAVRTEWIRDEALLRLADTLRVALFMDLPLSRLPARRMADTLEYARAVIDTAAALARRHDSIRAIGLGRFADTTDSTTCGVLRDLTGRLRSRDTSRVATYYVTRFVEADVCSDAVDLVLIDGRGASEPAALMRRWRAAGHEAPAGIASLGIWVRSDSLRGLAVLASPERQARYLETHLPVMLSDTLSPQPYAVFVHRWRDVILPYASAAYDLDRPYLDRFGLHALDGTTRPAVRVVRGIFTGRQNVFAFDRGTPPSTSAPWSVLFGWAIIASVGMFYALSPRFRHMLPRYFQARIFFRESVREGREVLLGASTTLLGAVGVAGGLITYVILDAARMTDAFSLALQWLPETTQGVVVTLLGRPVLLIVLVGCLHVIALIVWSVVLSTLSRRKYTLTPAQVLMLVVWPRWPMLAVMVAAMVSASLESPSAYLIGGMALAWFLIELASAVRTLVDFQAVTRIPIWMVVPAALLHPLVIVGGALALWMLSFQPEVAYLRHAILRS